MVAAVETVEQRPEWLRSRPFDFAFVQGIAAVALLSGLIVVLRPEIFTWVLAADLWLLGYHHVIATFTRLAFDRQSLREHRFFVFVLPLIVLATTFALAWLVGAWLIVSIYLYWQWFHYTRQSWGISQVYRAKSGGRVTDGPLFAHLSFYLVPAWGILYRSEQAPDTFLFLPLRVIPVPELLVQIVGAAAAASVAAWCYRRFVAWRRGELAVAHTSYMLSHYVVFAVGYVLIDDITFGWLVINIWHNAQYLFFVWLFNANRFRTGVDRSARFLSTISQPRNIVRYLFICLSITTITYGIAYQTVNFAMIGGVSAAIIVYQAVNFHHYIVDSFIWKVRKKPMRSTLDLPRS